MPVQSHTNLCHLAVGGEEDPCKWVRQAAIVSSKQTASLIHVCPQLKHLLHYRRGYRGSVITYGTCFNIHVNSTKYKETNMYKPLTHI